MTLLDLGDLNEHWKDHPPMQAMVQAYLGIKPSDSAPAERATPEQVKNLVDMLKGRRG